MSTRYLILAGGSGTRLWPLSRKLFAKHFLQIFENKSLLQHTISRLLPKVTCEDIFVVTNLESKFIVYDQVRQILPNFTEEQIIIEPASLNTLFSIIYSLAHFEQDDDFFVLPSDQYLQNDEDFFDLFFTHSFSNQNAIHLFGLPVKNLVTHYGYIQKSINQTQDSFKVAKFIEKPDKTQLEYINNNDFYTNSGILFFKKSTFLTQLQQYYPQGFQIFQDIVSKIPLNFNTIQNISVDKAILEKSSSLEMIIVNCELQDIISYADFDKLFSKDDLGNVINDTQNQTIQINSCDNVVFGKQRQIVTIGTKNLVIADTPDALLVADKSQLDSIPEAVESLRKQNESIVTIHKTAYRPWGSYTVLDIKDGYQVKQLTINPGKKISLQYHKHRSETWTVVQGVAEVIKGDQYLTLFQSQSVFIPANTNHRLFNPQSNEKLTIIEVQTGSYFGEDDIIRIEDDFDRK